MLLERTISMKNFTFLLLVACLLGVNFFSLNIGFFKLSLYRILILLSPLFFKNVIKSTLWSVRRGISFQYVLFMIFWISYSLVTVLWIQDTAAWAKAFSFLVTGFISTIFIFSFLNTKNDILYALKMIEKVSFLYSLLAFYEMFTGNYFFVTEKNIEYFQEHSLVMSAIGFREPVTVFGNPNDYSLYLFFSLVASLVLFKVKKRVISKIFSGLLILVYIFLIICTQSRAAFFGSCLFFLVYITYSFLRSSLLIKIRLIILVAILTGVGVFFLGDKLDIFRDVATIDFSNSEEGSSDAIRKNLIKNGIYFLGQTFGMGLGLGNIEYHMTNNAIYDVGDVGNIHNWWLEVLVSSGVLVFLFYMVVYVKSMYSTYRRTLYSNDQELNSLLKVFLCSFPSFIIASIGASSLMGSEWIWPLMAIQMKVHSIFNE